MSPILAGAESMRELIGAVGYEEARRICQEFGGTTIYVPIRVPEGHPLRVKLGAHIVAKLEEYYGGSRLAVPKDVERRAKVFELRQSGGHTIADIALMTGYSERQIYRVLRQRKESLS